MFQIKFRSAISLSTRPSPHQTGTGTGSDTGTDTGTDTGIDTDTGTGTDTGIDTGTDTTGTQWNNSELFGKSQKYLLT